MLKILSLTLNALTTALLTYSILLNRKTKASALGVTGKIRSNRAGVALYGDVRLIVGDGDTNRLEVVLLTEQFPEEPATIKVLYRRLVKDHLGLERSEHNRWTTLREAEVAPEVFLAKLLVEMSAHDGN